MTAQEKRTLVLSLASALVERQPSTYQSLAQLADSEVLEYAWITAKAYRLSYQMEMK